MKGGEVFSNSKEEEVKRVRVEIPHGYDMVRQLLRAMERTLRKKREVKSWDRTYYIPSRGRMEEVVVERDGERREEKRRRDRYRDSAAVVIEPARSDRKDREGRSKTKRRSSRYEPVIVDWENDDMGFERLSLEDDGAVEERRRVYRREHERDERRDSFFESEAEILRRQEGYRVELREPDREDRVERKGKPHRKDKRERRERKLGYWV